MTDTKTLDVAIRVIDVGKEYRLGGSPERYLTLRDQLRKWAAGGMRALWRGARRAEQQTLFWALKDVSLEIRRGEVVGIIGRNGAGKSTLLKILSRITEPTRGAVDIHGRVGSLLEVGTGFHSELSGRENLYLNGAILGMRRSEITRKFDEIVAFAEVEKFIDTPVKFYSSGMYMRLAFAVAAHLEPEILIVDEVLAVGDAEFQKKCLGKMGDVARGGRTVLFVSHNLAAIRSLCSRATVLDKGRLVFDGPAEQAIARYSGLGGENLAGRWVRPGGHVVSKLYFQEIAVQLDGDQPALQLNVAVRMAGNGPFKPAFIAADVQDATGVTILQAIPTIKPFIRSGTPSHDFRVTIELPPLIPGTYAVTLWAGPSHNETYDLIENAATFEVVTSPTPERTFPHTRDHGWLAPRSHIDHSVVQQLLSSASS